MLDITQCTYDMDRNVTNMSLFEWGRSMSVMSLGMFICSFAHGLFQCVVRSSALGSVHGSVHDSVHSSAYGSANGSAPSSADGLGHWSGHDKLIGQMMFQRC